jgi:hypothetical protein
MRKLKAVLMLGMKVTKIWRILKCISGGCDSQKVDLRKFKTSLVVVMMFMKLL